MMCAPLAVLFAAASVAVSGAASNLESNTLAVNVDLVAAVNANPSSTWVAEAPIRFNKWTHQQLKNLCGAWPEQNGSSTLPTLDLPPRRPTDTPLPTDFDGRQKWPQCAATIAHVRDQSDCGSCWAFATTEAFNDRRCIQTNITTLLSPLDTASCCSGSACGHSNGCVGGQIGPVWAWFVSVGVVTGGDYDDINKSDTCAPYPFACTHNKTSGSSLPLCPPSEYTIPTCASSCGNSGYTTPYATDKVKATSSFKIKPYPYTDVQTELMQYGPVSTVMTVFGRCNG
jgi:cathepsin B